MTPTDPEVRSSRREKWRDAKMKGEKARVLANIAAQTERPAGAYWLSFAGEEGFRTDSRSVGRKRLLVRLVRLMQHLDQIGAHPVYVRGFAGERSWRMMQPELFFTLLAACVITWAVLKLLAKGGTQ